MSSKILSLAEFCKVNTDTISYGLFYRDMNKVYLSRYGTWARRSDGWKASSQKLLLLHHLGEEPCESC